MKCSIQTAENLRDVGYEVHVLTTNTEQQSEYENKDGIIIYRVSSKILPDPLNLSVPNFFKFWSKMDELFKQNNFDAVLVNKTWFVTSLLASVYCKLHKIPYFVQLDTLVGKIWFSDNKSMNAAMWLYIRTIGLLMLKWSKKCIVYHEGLVPAMNEWKLKYELISQGVDIDKFQYAKPSQEVLQFKKERVCFLFVGRLDEIKRWKEYVETCKKILEERKGKVCFCFVCGAKHPEEQDRLREALGRDDGLVLGYRTDIAEIMKACDVLVLPSKSEGMPDVIMEAMASKLTIISSRVGGVPGLIKDDESGYLFDDFNQLHNKMILLADYKSRRESFANEAFQNVLQHDNEKIKEKLKKVLT